MSESQIKEKAGNTNTIFLKCSKKKPTTIFSPLKSVVSALIYRTDVCWEIWVDDYLSQATTLEKKKIVSRHHNLFSKCSLFDICLLSSSPKLTPQFCLCELLDGRSTSKRMIVRVSFEEGDVGPSSLVKNLNFSMNLHFTKQQWFPVLHWADFFI